ncbi:MAG TPA: ATP-binding protein [Polyangia bacterium]|nr:ATP-binding protein [Polyangia bacterium]
MSGKPPADGKTAERRPLRLLMVEDDPNDEALVLRHLRQNGYDVTHLRVDTGPAMRTALGQPWDLVLSDFSMPTFSATAALAVLKEVEIDIPFIIVSGTISEENAVDSMRAGAQDFLPKDKLARLVPAIERELREAAIRGERRKMQERLFVSDRMVSMGTLAAGVAHEINNPLAALVANLDLVALSLAALSKPNVVGPAAATARPAVPEALESRLREIEEPLSDAREAADRVRQIVRDVRVFSRVEGSERRAVDVRRILDSSVRIAWNEIRNRARVTKSYGEVPAVLGNESRLGQVFLNLIVNAAQAIAEGNPAGNEIEITTARAGDGRVVVDVRDTGSGIPAALRGKIFDAFFTTKPEGVGTGLGLSICHRLITEMGGAISVDSEEGKGSRFRVTLQAAGLEAPIHTPPLVPMGAARRGRILVVDDEAILGAVVRRMLGTQHEVSTLTSAREAAERIGGGERYDVIFTDLVMPDMTGMDLHADLARRAPDQAERMVFMSGGAFSARSRDFLSQVPNPRISKPFDAGTLAALVHNLIR